VKRVKLTIPDQEPEESPEKGDFLVIRINKDWRLKHDGLQFCVQKRKFNVAKGTTYWSDQDIYCRHLDMAIYFLASRRIYMEPGLVGAEGMERLFSALDAIRLESILAATQATVAALNGTREYVKGAKARMLPADYAALMKILDPVEPTKP
jgi:hypothetical protein